MPKNRGSKIRVWKNSSLSNPDETYETIRWENGDFTCDCRAWKFPRNGIRYCRHVRSAEAAFRQPESYYPGGDLVSRVDEFLRSGAVETSEIANKINPKKYYRMIRVAE